MDKPPIPKKKVPLPPNAKKKKDFTVEQCVRGKRGEKIIEYAPPGMGKTTLALLAPTPIFLSIDNGVHELVHPVTGEPPSFVGGIEDFADVLTVLNDHSLFKGHETIVVDNGTDLEHLAIPYVLKTVHGKKGNIMPNIEAYGWKEGYGHLWDAMRKVKVALDKLSAAGKNVIFITHLGQVKMANPGGADFLCDAPNLYHGHPRSNITQFVGWANHVLKIDYDYVTVEGKKAAGSTERIIRVHPEVHYIAKSRTLPIKYKNVAFKTETDDTIWKLIFGGKQKE